MPVLEEIISSVPHWKHHGLDIVTVQVEGSYIPRSARSASLWRLHRTKERGEFLRDVSSRDDIVGRDDSQVCEQIVQRFGPSSDGIPVQ